MSALLSKFTSESLLLFTPILSWVHVFPNCAQLCTSLCVHLYVGGFSEDVSPHPASQAPTETGFTPLSQLCFQIRLPSMHLKYLALVGAQQMLILFSTFIWVTMWVRVWVSFWPSVPVSVNWSMFPWYGLACTICQYALWVLFPSPTVLLSEKCYPYFIRYIPHFIHPYTTCP